MRPGCPNDFGFLAVLAFGFALLMAVPLADTAPSDTRFVDRAVGGLAGALALLTAEALWRVRPWGFSASIAFAGSFVILPIVVDPGWPAVAFSGISALFIIVALSIVHRGLFPGPTLIRAPRTP